MKFLWGTAGLSAVLSIVCAHIAQTQLTERIAVLGSFAGFQLTYNTGIAFGVQLPPVIQSLLIGIALIIVVGLAYFSPRSTWNAMTFGLILGGGIANVIDRILDGMVTDFIQVGTFPIFNIADSCITIGVVLMGMQMLLQSKDGMRE